MTAKITHNLRLRNAQDFIENLVNHPITAPKTAADGSHKVDRNHYIFIGRTKEWPSNLLADPVVSETSPPTPQNTLTEELEAREHLIALKKIKDADATLALRRFNWDSNTVYAPYDVTDGDLINHPTQSEIIAATSDGSYYAGSHYVLTDEFHIFKCLNNGNGAKSSFKPILPSSPPYTVSYPDGYVWKYMASVSPMQAQNFLTNQWIPIKTLKEADESTQWMVQTTAINGALDSYLIPHGGSGYIYTYTGTLETADATSAVLPDDGRASAVDGAYTGSHVWITGGDGFPSGPFVVNSYLAATRKITIDSEWEVGAGTTVEILPRVIITGNGAGAKAKAVVDTLTQKIVQIVPISVGEGYTTVSAQVVGGTRGSPAIVAPQIAPLGGHGSDIERELNASYVMLMTRLPFDESVEDFPLSNDYRQIGIIRDVRTLTGAIANSETLRASQGLKLANVSNGPGGAFQPDDLIVGLGDTKIARARVVAIIKGQLANEVTLHLYQDSSTGYETFDEDMTITGSLTGATGTVAAGGKLSPEIDRLSGDILYIDNRRAVLRAPNQTEILRAVIKF